ncbi:cytochrome P450 [Saccharothrix lopnurensis]|uniref:Cytochrome P450 n=1 Tax=Saccharothrix lopnurensis TaxID=1670621 RepID=A0ABW1PFJ7_9PSEU
MTRIQHDRVDHARLVGGESAGYLHHQVEDAARGIGPVHLAHQANGVRVHILTLGWEQARALLNNHAGLTKDAVGIASVMREHMIEAGVEPNVTAVIGGSMINADPPEHTRLRRPVAAVLTPRRVQELRRNVVGITRALLDEVDPGQPVDVVAGLALPLPLMVICELLGVPAQDRGMLAGWSSAMMTEVPEQQQPASEAMAGYLAALIEDKRVRPDEGLLSMLVHTGGEDRLAPEEVLTTAVLMVLAGHETTTAAIGNTLAALLHTGQWSAVAAAPDSVPDVVRESLRWDPPTRNIPHYLVREPVDLGGGVTLSPSALVMVNLGSANRDPEAFGPDAHRFVPFRPRPARSHLTFGMGWHRCVGSVLATMETEIAVGEVLARWPRARPAIAVERMPRNPYLVTNGFTEVGVVLVG